MSPHCDLDHEDSKPIISHDTLAHDDASPYHVWLQKISSWEDMVQMKIQSHDMKIHDMMMLWPWPWACHSNAIFLLDNPAYDDVPSNQSLVAKGSVLKGHSRESMWACTVTLTLKQAKQPFCMTLLLMTMHNHNKFGDKWFIGSEDFIRTSIHWQFFCCFAVPLTLNTGQKKSETSANCWHSEKRSKTQKRSNRTKAFCLTFCVFLTLSTANFFFFSQDTPAYKLVSYLVL